MPKYNYFYTPQGHNVNTDKHMRFDGDESEVGWRKLGHFMQHADKHVYMFAMNQIRRRIG